MLNRQNRLTTKDFKRLSKDHKSGVAISTSLFNAKVYSNKMDDETGRKLGLVISKKYFKKANKRNALKRKICYAYRQVLKDQNKDFIDKNMGENTQKNYILYYIKKDAEQKLPEYKIIKNNLEEIIKK